MPLSPAAAEFLARPGRAGAVGALLDEYARAADDFCRVVETFDHAAYTTERASADPDTRSVRAICLHAIGAAHRYADYVLKARGLPYEERWLPPADAAQRPADVRGALRASLRHTEDVLDPLDGADYATIRALELQVRWGPRYDPEMLMEHAIVHLLRHRRQLERWER